MAAVSQSRLRVAAPAPSASRASVDDAQLMVLIAGRNADALAELYDRHGASAYALALRVTHDAGLAEEAVQDGFLSIWRSAERFDCARGAPRSWLLTIVHRRAVDRLRRPSLRRERPAAAPPEGGGPSTAESVEIRAERLLVRQALGDLPFVQRQALELAYYAGLTQRQIAQLVGVPVGTVKSRTYAALTTLRVALS